MPVLELLAPEAGEQIFDRGCGNGALSVELGCTVIGVDASAAMISAAEVLGLNAYAADRQSLSFANEFDAVFSNAALDEPS